MAQNQRQKISPKLWMFISVLFIILFAITINSHTSTINDQLAMIATREAELVALQKEAEDLERKIDFTETRAYIERTARDILDLAYPDEIRFKDSSIEE